MDKRSDLILPLLAQHLCYSVSWKYLNTRRVHAKTFLIPGALSALTSFFIVGCHGEWKHPFVLAFRGRGAQATLRVNLLRVDLNWLKSAVLVLKKTNWGEVSSEFRERLWETLFWNEAQELGWWQTKQEIHQVKKVKVVRRENLIKTFKKKTFLPCKEDTKWATTKTILWLEFV